MTAFEGAGVSSFLSNMLEKKRRCRQDDNWESGVSRMEIGRVHQPVTVRAQTDFSMEDARRPLLSQDGWRRVPRACRDVRE
jgi:hypothetical protein